MRVRKQLFIVALSLFTLCGSSASLRAQSAPDPINAAQLKTLLNETKAIKAEKAETNRMIQARYKQLPEWFPPTLRSMIGGQVASINPLKSDLPIYQKYFSRTQADQLILFFQGPAGDAVAAKLPPQATQPASPADLAPLIDARINQLDAAQQAAVRETLTAYQAALPRIRDDQGTAFDTAFETSKSSIIAAHKAEYDAASGGTGVGGSLAH